MVQIIKKKQTKRTKKLLTSLNKNRSKLKLSKGKLIQKDQKISDVNKKKISIEKKKERNRRKKEEDEENKEGDVEEEENDATKVVIDDSNDFTNEKYLGNMDISSFFESIVDKEEEENKKDESKENEKEEKANDDDDDNPSSSHNEDEELDDIEKEEAEMKEELKKLKDADPDFHDYLQENERDLLEFSDDDIDEDEIDIYDDDDEEEEESSSKDLISLKEIEKYENEEVLSIKSLKKVIKVYKNACCSSDLSKVTSSADVFDRLLMLTLSRCHTSFRKHLVGEDSSENVEEVPIPENKLNGSSNWKMLKYLLKHFFKSTHRLLTQAKQPKLRIFILEQLKPYLAFLSAFSSYAMHYFKLFLYFWSSTLSSDATHQIRLESYLCIRILSLTQPFPFIETALKKTYLSYARISKFVTNHDANFATLTLLGNCCVDLYSIDTDSSYQHAFVYIRQLALLLRKAKTEPTSDSIRAVYCWQYIHCCKLWVAVLAANPDDLNQLFYPITELLFGVIRLVPEHVKFLPLKFQAIRLLQQLSSSTDIFIPTLSFLLDVLDDSKNWISRMHKGQKSSRTTQIIRLPFLLKLPNTVQNPSPKYMTKEHQQIILQEVFTLLRHDVELYKYSPAFPEYSTPILMHVRKFKQEQKDTRNKNFAKHLLQIVQTNIEFILKARTTLAESPKDVKTLECCKPIEVKNRTLRYKDLIDKEKKEFILLSSQNTSKPADNKDITKKDDAAIVNTTKKDNKEKKKPVKSKKERKEPILSATDEMEILQEEDTLKAGLDWSDNEEDDDDGSDDVEEY